MRHERRNDIVEKIRKQKTIKVQDLMKEYQVSIETVREDLAFLEKKGYLRRVYGGAVLQEYYSPIEMEYRQREQYNSSEKQAIAKTAASLINDGDSIFISYGTTTTETVRNLAGKTNLTFLTNAVLVAQELAQVSVSSKGWKIILLGGELRQDELTMYGTVTTTTLKNFRIAKALLGVSGIDIKAGLTDYNVEEAGVHRLAIEQANTVIALTDHDKFGVVTLNRICPVDSLDVIVTDWLVPEADLEEYRSLGIKVYVSREEK